MPEMIQEAHPYDLDARRFAIQTLCRAVAEAQSWDEIMCCCEALSNVMRIAKHIENDATRDLQSAFVQLKELRQQIREFEHGDGPAGTQPSIQEDTREVVAQRSANQQSKKVSGRLLIEEKVISS